MKIIFHNLITTLKRFKTPVILNILGLSVAFASFIIIMMQVMFELGYDHSYSKSNRTYRLGFEYQNVKYGCYYKHLVPQIKSLSPHIEDITIIGPYEFRDKYHKVKRANGSEVMFEASINETLPSFIDMFDIEIVEGDRNVLNSPNTLLMPQSLALKVFGNESPIGQMFGRYPVGAVYRDLPKNTIIPNEIYASLPIDSKVDISFNHYVLLTLDSPENAEPIFKQINSLIVDMFCSFANEEGIDSTVLPKNNIQLISNVYFNKTTKFDLGPKGNTTTTGIFLAVAILIIIIASINYINFASALTPIRIKIINMQKILGGSLGVIRCSLLIESVVIVLLAFILGVLLVFVLNSTQLPSHFDADLSLNTNFATLLMSLGVALIIGILSGIHPTFYMTSFKPIVSISSSFGRSAKGRQLRSVLIGIQYIISIVLIISMLMINRQNRYIKNFAPGYNTDRVVVSKIPQPFSYEQRCSLEAKIQAKADIDGIAFSMFEFGGSEDFSISGIALNGDNIMFNVCYVSHNFLDVLGIPVVEGRNFTKFDLESNNTYTIINHQAKSYGFGLDYTFWGNYKVVGITSEDLNTLSLRNYNTPFMFVISPERSSSYKYAYIRIKDGSNTSNAIESIKNAFKQVEPTFVPELKLIDELSNKLYQKEQRASYLISAFSVLAIIISLIGVFGLVLFETQYRRKEIGVRRVFGASISGILAMLNRKFIIIVLVCFVVASPLAYYAMNRWLSTFAYHTNITWWIFAIALLIVLIITTFTVTIRCYRTATENPSNTTKTE